MTRLERAKAYAAAAYERNKETICSCPACIDRDAKEKLEQVQRIIAAREQIEEQAQVAPTVCKFERRRRQ